MTGFSVVREPKASRAEVSREAERRAGRRGSRVIHLGSPAGESRLFYVKDLK